MIFKIRSQSNPKKMHQVIDYGTDWQCDCAGFIYHKTCKHINLAQRIWRIKTQYSTNCVPLVRTQ